jgi:hypothetical protein
MAAAIASKKRSKGRDNENNAASPESREIKVNGAAILPPGTEGLVPPSSLFVSSSVQAKQLVDAAVSTVFSFDNFMTPVEADQWITFGETQGFQHAKHAQTSGIAHRDCGRLVIDDQDLADIIFTRLRPLVPETIVTADKKPWHAVTCSANLRLYKYGVGQRFGKHYDESNDVSNERRTFFTVLLYLNGRGGAQSTRTSSDDERTEAAPLQGGHTNFFLEVRDKSPVCSMAPLKGSCLVHEHGEKCLPHEGAAVLQGTKYLLRTDVVYERSGPSRKKR